MASLDLPKFTRLTNKGQPCKALITKECPDEAEWLVEFPAVDVRILRQVCSRHAANLARNRGGGAIDLGQFKEGAANGI